MVGKFMYLLVLVVVIIYGSSNVAGEVHKVGESSGWTNLILNTSYYKSWTASKLFRVGDTILFEYNKEFHNVVRVTHEKFNACNSTAPYATWASGNDSFTIRRPGHYYFICGVGNHCGAGQKIDIRVLILSSSQDQNSSGPSPSPHSSGPTVPSPPSVVSASPSPPSHPPKKTSSSSSSSSSSLNSDFKLWLCVVAISLAAIGF